MSFTEQIGIDIGTTHSRVSIFKDGRPHVVANELVSNLTPSYVAYTEKLCHVGVRAKQQAVMNVPNTIYVPSQFDCYQRRAVKDAADILGLENELINETTAAAIAYAFENKSEFVNKKKNLLIYNMGGGFTTAQATTNLPPFEKDIVHFQRRAAECQLFKSGVRNSSTNVITNMCALKSDMTIVTVENQKANVLCTAGDLHLGGDDFDQILVDHCCHQFYRKHQVDLKKEDRALCRLRRACEKTKRDLSFSVQATVDVEDLLPGKDFEVPITRTEFERMCYQLFEMAICPVTRVFEDFRRKTQIDETILVGGATRMPRIQQLLQNRFPLIHRNLNLSVNQDEAAVLGAAVRIAGAVAFQDVIPEELCICIPKYCDPGDFKTTVFQRNQQFPGFIKKTHHISGTTITVDVYQGELSVRFELNNDYRNKWLTLDFSVDSDGILKVNARLDRPEKIPLLPYPTNSISDNEIELITNKLARYKKHRAVDSERILANDARHALVGFVKMMPEKAQCKKVRDIVENWLEKNPDAKSTEYKKMLDVSKNIVTGINKDHSSEKAP